MAINSVSFPLALSRSGQYLYCSLHKVKNPSQLSKRLKNDDNLALINANRLVGISQLCCAANMACNRNRPTWDTVFLSAASSHLGHVLRDYAFLGEEDSRQDDEKAEEEAMVVVFMVSSDSQASYEKWLENYGLGEPMPNMEDYLLTQQENSKADFQTWYKLTDQELSSSSLEACLLTKIATKMV